ncbi:MAG: polysaccharide biosynthesis C-terminal domain-containing protein [Vicinamibacterales bacterium]
MRHRIVSLYRNLTIYGLGDVAVSVVNFLLLPIFVRHLSTIDYGILGLLQSIEVVAKIVFRFGLDGSFMRMFFDCADDRARQRLASTIFLFLAIVDGLVLLPLLVFAGPLADRLFGITGYDHVLQLSLVNIFVMGFSFIPFHVLRIEERAVVFSALTLARSVGTIAARLTLVIGLGMGVFGVVLADIVVSAAITLALTRWYAPLLRPMLSRALLAEALAFGLPRLPHGVSHQIMAVADRYILRLFVGLHEIGLYSIGATFGLALKLFLSAFEYAWAPFYFATMKEPDAKETFRLVTTYSLAVLVLLAAGASAVAADVVRVMTTPEFYDAALVIPWIALGVLLQGVYLLTSIGLNITKNTRYYPVATGLAALTSVSANFLLVPRFGMLGAAWSNALAYGTLAGASYWFSQRVYPIAYERRRLAKIVLAGLVAFGAAEWLVPASLRPIVGVLLRGATVVIVYPLALFALRFYAPRELRHIGELWRRSRTGRGPVPAPAEGGPTAGTSP